LTSSRPSAPVPLVDVRRQGMIPPTSTRRAARWRSTAPDRGAQRQFPRWCKATFSVPTGKVAHRRYRRLHGVADSGPSSQQHSTVVFERDLHPPYRPYQAGPRVNAPTFICLRRGRVKAPGQSRGPAVSHVDPRSIRRSRRPNRRDAPSSCCCLPPLAQCKTSILTCFSSGEGSPPRSSASKLPAIEKWSFPQGRSRAYRLELSWIALPMVMQRNPAGAAALVLCRA